ncbi:uncharacterized protein LOC115334318 isoform X3 [Aquila chrysaetos chrysaetos]|uniref:uncharacterized protein LOC115334318 isoform X3 n=1 Tax=Aquila chrysaetos chrysaetos TaxID=223781 RepID=UPI001B7D3C20|nr:uncharacterized protein LOC115334318 isoform X3 [Aquila chrysaetos chrysaetos]
MGSLGCQRGVSQAPAAWWEQRSPLTPSCPPQGWAFPASHCSLWPEGPSGVSLVGTRAMPAPATGLGPALWLRDAARDLPISTQDLDVPRTLPFPGPGAEKPGSDPEISPFSALSVHGHGQPTSPVSVGCQQPPLSAPLPNAAPFQVCAHDKAWDLLRPNSRALQVMDVAPLGLIVEEATEIAVPDAQAAISVYTWGLGAIPALFQGCAQQPPADGCSATQGAGSLFTLTVERELEGGRHRRSALRILAPGGAIGPCPEPAPAASHPPPDTGCLPWIVERMLEGNSLTFLLLCVTLPGSPSDWDAALGCPLPEVSPHPAPHLALGPWVLPGDTRRRRKLDTGFTHPHQPRPWARHWDVPVLVDPRGPCPGLAALPDTSREEMLAALQLAKRVKGLAKTISATLWDPVQEVAARRREIRGLRMELLAGAGLPEQKMAVDQLRRALRELQVLKSQGWEKKQAAAEVLRTSQMHQPSAKDWVSTGNTALGQQPGTQTPPTSASLEPAGRERGDRHTPHAWVADMWARSVTLHGLGVGESSRGGESQAPASAGQGLPEEPSPSKAPQPWPMTRGDTAGSQRQPCPSLEVQYALAKAQRQRLRAQHCLLLQRELGDGAVPDQEASREVGTRLSFPGTALPGQGSLREQRHPRAALSSSLSPTVGCSSLAKGGGHAGPEPGGSTEGAGGSRVGPGGLAAEPPAGDAGLQAAPAAGWQGGLGTHLQAARAVPGSPRHPCRCFRTSSAWQRSRGKPWTVGTGCCCRRCSGTPWSLPRTISGCGTPDGWARPMPPHRHPEPASQGGGDSCPGRQAGWGPCRPLPPQPPPPWSEPPAWMPGDRPAPATAIPQGKASCPACRELLPEETWPQGGCFLAEAREHFTPLPPREKPCSAAGHLPAGAWAQAQPCNRSRAGTVRRPVAPQLLPCGIKWVPLHQ